MQVINATKGNMDHFYFFYGSDVEFENYGSHEVYAALKEYASKDLLNSSEMWVATFVAWSGQNFAIMADGAAGEYVVADII